MEGVINVLKPPGMTSFDVVNYLRKILHIKKVGHTGTLDPDAVGVLPICFGRATKAIEYMANDDKEYRAELTLGIETSTEDSSGKIIRKSNIKKTEGEIQEAIMSFLGRYEQVPPMYSAVKINGQKLYELARKGIEVERNKREVFIRSINIINISKDGTRVIFDVECTKGTYIRTLCSDIGKNLGCGGHMSFLIRKRSGKFLLEDSLTLEKIKELVENNRANDCLRSIDIIFSDYAKIKLDSKNLKRFLNGLEVAAPKEELSGDTLNNNIIAVQNIENKIVALAKIKKVEEEIFLKSEKQFVLGG